MQALVISPDPGIARQLEKVLTAIGGVTVCQTLNDYPALPQLPGSLRSQAIDVVFLSFAEVDKAVQIVKFLDQEAEGVQTIAFDRESDSASLRESMRVGIREFLVAPFEEHAARECLSRTRDLLARHRPTYAATDEIFAFMPSKPGVGTSTLALNIGAALGKKLGGRALLADFDLGCGMIRFMLKLTNEHSVMDALEHSMHLDERLWRDLVTHTGTLDVLHAGNINPTFQVAPERIASLLSFARRLYGAVCFDLPGNLDQLTIEVLKETKRIFLVCTPEVSSLHIARQKLAFLRKYELAGRVEVLLNRDKPKAAFSVEGVQQVLGMPVRCSFPNDYMGVTRAMTEARVVDAGSELGRQIQKFADSLSEKSREPEPRPAGRKFLDFFSIPRTAA
jgi:pilus assembly protein CpaE